MAVTRGPDQPQPDPARVRRSRELGRWHRQWAAEQADLPFEPRHAGSDYNQHVPDLEADGLAEDEFARRADQIIASSR